MGVYLYTQCPRSPVRVLFADRQQAKCGVSLRLLTCSYDDSFSVSSYACA